MPAIGDILRRFRFHGVPGAPAAVAVPADRSSVLRGELAPVFEALAGSQRDATATAAAAERDAHQKRVGAADEARRIVAEARAGVVAARDEAAAARFTEAEVECRRVRAAGQAEAARVGRAAEERMDALAELVAATVLEMADGTAEGEERSGS